MNTTDNTTTADPARSAWAGSIMSAAMLWDLMRRDLPEVQAAELAQALHLGMRPALITELPLDGPPRVALALLNDLDQATIFRRVEFPSAPPGAVQ